MLDEFQSEKIEQLITDYPGRVFDFLDSCNKSQWQSKLWIIDELNLYLFKYGKRKPNRFAILGGWYGLLAEIIYENIGVEIEGITSIDSDSLSADIGWIFCKDTDVINFEINDIKNLNYGDYYDVILNTSVEHMEQSVVDYSIEVASPGTVFVLQSNNLFELSEHINCSKSETEFNKNFVDKLDNVVHFTKPWPTDYGRDNWERYMLMGGKKNG